MLFLSSNYYSNSKSNSLPSSISVKLKSNKSMLRSSNSSNPTTFLNKGPATPSKLPCDSSKSFMFSSIYFRFTLYILASNSTEPSSKDCGNFKSKLAEEAITSYFV